MAGVGVYVRAQWRRRRLTWVAVALLVGLAGAVVLCAAAGARRTDTAYDRYLRATHGADLLLSPANSGVPGLYAALGRVPGGVVAPVIGFGLSPVGHAHEPFLLTAAADTHFGNDIERPKLTQGRLPRADANDEVVADTTAARAYHLHAGSTLHVFVAHAEEELPSASDPKITLRVVGVGISRDSVVPVNALATQPVLLANAAFSHRFGSAFYAFDGAYVALSPGASKAAYIANAQRVAAQFPKAGGSWFVADESQQAAKVTHAIRPQAVALALFALLAAIAALFAVGQVISRVAASSSADYATLRATGMARSELFALGALPAAAISAAGAVIAAGVAIVGSAFMPIGPARRAEPHPGIAIDWTVIGLGVAALLVVLLAIVAWSAWRASLVAPAHNTDIERGRLHASRAETHVMRSGVAPTTAIGISHAVDAGSGARAVPLRSALLGVVVAVAALAGSLTFALNLSRLVHTPRLYGQAWDVTADAQFSAMNVKDVDAQLSEERGVVAWSYGDHGQYVVNGRLIPAISITPGHGPLLAPTVIAGRAANAPDEIALGTKTLDAIRRRVGDTVTVDTSGGGQPETKPAPMHVVARSVFPFFGEGSFTPAGLGTGAQVVDASGGKVPKHNFFLVRIAPGPHHEADVARVAHDLGTVCNAGNQCAVTTTSRPVDVLNYSRVQSTPIGLATVLAALATLVVAYVLITSVRRRRRDFAILKTLGFTRPQVSATVAWQATSVVVVALIVGLPLGILAGRLVWSTFATNLGIPDDVATPTVALLVTIGGALVVANAIAAVPGIVAGRLRPAAVLRAD